MADEVTQVTVQLAASLQRLQASCLWLFEDAGVRVEREDFMYITLCYNS